MNDIKKEIEELLQKYLFGILYTLVLLTLLFVL